MKYALTFLSILSLTTAAFAGEEDLYAPVPPSDSAFVRTVNASENKNLSITFDGLNLNKGSNANTSDFAVIKQGDHTLSAGEHKETVKIEAKQYYTLVSMPDGTLKVIKDKLIDDPTKATIYFYNLSSAGKASLESPTHKATIFKDVASGASDSREINEVTLGLNVMADGGEAGKLENVELKRQQGTSIFLTGKPGAYQVTSIQNKVAQ